MLVIVWPHLSGEDSAHHHKVSLQFAWGCVHGELRNQLPLKCPVFFAVSEEIQINTAQKIFFTWILWLIQLEVPELKCALELQRTVAELDVHILPGSPV